MERRTREHGISTLAAALMLGLLLVAPANTGASPVPVQPAEGGRAQAPAQHEAEGAAEHGSPVVDLLAKLINFGIMAGTLVYFLRSPLATYLSDRGIRIRGDLLKAAGMKEAAAAQLAELDRKMAALPAELAALRQAGAGEVAAEEARIRHAAEAERARLLESARREIGVQLRIAERELVRHAADLAVAVASERIKATITDADHRKLVDRYVAQVSQAASHSQAQGARQ